MSELYEALEREQINCEIYADAARANGNLEEAAYWLGYLEATTNAAALIYGPTPLDETERN